MQTISPDVSYARLPVRAIFLISLLAVAASTLSAQTLSIVSGNGQLICSLCPTQSFAFDPLVVQVKNAAGAPVANATVTWTVSAPTGVAATVDSATTVTGPDGTSSNTFRLEAPRALLLYYNQATVRASIGGSSVTFTETNAALASGGTGIPLVQVGLVSPPSGTVITGPAGSAFSVPVQVKVGPTAGGGVPGVELRVVSDPSFAASAICTAPGYPPNSILTDASGNATCNLQFGSATGDGKIRIYVGDKYATFGPYNINVTPGSGPPPPSASAQLTAAPASLNFSYPGPLSQTVLVTSSSGTVNYTVTIQQTIAAVTWLSVTPPTAPAATTPTSSFQVSLNNPQSLQPGAYGATIILHPDNGSSDVPVPVQLTVGGGSTGSGQLSASPASLTFQSAGPLTQTVTVSSSSGSVSYTAAVQITLAAVTWLSVGQPTGAAAPGAPSSFPVTVNPQGLPPATYTAYVDIHPANGTPDVVVRVDLNVGSVTATPQLTATPASLSFQSTGPLVQTVTLSSTGGTVGYTASAASANWLTIAPASGAASSTAPATLQVSIAPQSLAPGTYQASIVVHANNGTPDVTIPVRLTASAPAAPSTLNVTPPSLTVNPMAGSGPVSAGAIGVTTTGPAVPFVASTSGAGWLSISQTGATTPGQVSVTVNPAGLQPGNYSATVTISAAAAVNSPIAVTIVLNVQPAARLQLSTGALNFTSQAGSPAPQPQTVMASAAGGSVPFSAVASVTSPPGVNWLSVTPATGTLGASGSGLTVSVDPSQLPPGTYTGTVTLTSSNAANSPQTVAVTYTVATLPTPLPALIANAASGIAGPVAPGEIISIFGRNLGPSTGVPTAVTSGFVQTAISQAQVTFDNIPAPLLYVSDGQINAIVPYALAGRATTQLVVAYRNSSSAAVTLNVADTAPGIFMLNPSGQGAVLNQDGSVNDPTNPAASGSTIVIYATGEGSTAPAGEDGRIIPADGSQLKRPLLPVAVTIGGLPAQVQYAGSAPALVSGMLQVNAVIPDGAPTGNAVPVVITVGSAASQPATVAIQ